METIFIFAVGIMMLPDHTTHHAYPGVCINDIGQFGTCKEDARFCYKIAQRHISHYNEIIMSRYKFDVYMRWKEDANKRLAAWDYLDNCFMCGADPINDYEWKLKNLYFLKKTIGDDAYHSRKMPCPCPQTLE